MQVSGRSCAKKGGFEFIAFAVLEVADHPNDLLLFSGANYFDRVVINGDNAYLPHGANAWACQEHWNNPQTKVLYLQPPGHASQATERIVEHSKGVGAFPHRFDYFGFGQPTFTHFGLGPLRSH
jgi:hypothetical protein